MKYNAPLENPERLTSLTFAGKLGTVDQPKPCYIEDRAAPPPLWFDYHFYPRANDNLLRASDIEQIMEQHRAGAIQLHQCHCLRPAQRSAIAVDMTKGIADEHAGSFDFDLFGEWTEAAFTKQTCRQVNLLARPATGGDQRTALLQGVKKYLPRHTYSVG